MKCQVVGLLNSSNRQTKEFVLSEPFQGYIRQIWHLTPQFPFDELLHGFVASQKYLPFESSNGIVTIWSM